MTSPRRKIRWKHAAPLLGILLAAAPRCVEAQSGAAWRLITDNDALALWIPVERRTDREYTSGISVSRERAGRAWSVGQQIYTGHHFNSVGSRAVTFRAVRTDRQYTKQLSPQRWGSLAIEWSRE